MKKMYVWAVGIAVLAGAACAEEKNNESSRWHGYVGPAWRTGIKVDARGGSVAPADGWVRPDGTGAGSTLDWGVQNVSQIHIDPDPIWGGNIYTLHINDGRASSMSEDGIDEYGATAALTYDLMVRESFRVGFRLGAAGYWGLRQELGGIQHGNIYLMPSGDLIYGGALPPALVSSGNPLADSEALLTPIGTFPSGGVKLTVKSDLYQFALGPELAWDPIERLRLFVAPALLLNFANLRMSSEAANALGQIGGADESATKFLLGGGIQGGFSYSLTECLGIGGTVGYEWIQKAEADCGSTEVEIDYSSLTLSVGIVVNF